MTPNPVPLFGTRQGAQPTAQATQTVTGKCLPAFADDWYHRIHVFPASIDLGVIAGQVQVQVEVWNAFFTAQTLTSITPSGTYAGLTLSGQPSPPLGFGALQARAYTVDAGNAPVINANYIFAFGNGYTVYLLVTGQGAVVFAFHPDWASGVFERLEWLTEVIEAHDGSEQRIRLRQQPRLTIEYQVLLHGSDIALLENVLFAHGARTLAMPVWHTPSVLTSGLAAGSTAITVADGSDYTADGLAILWQSPQRAEAVEILAVNGNTLTLKRALTGAWPPGTRVYPAVFVRLDGEITLTHQTDAIAIGKIRAVAEKHVLQAQEGAQSYQGLPVLALAPTWAEDISASWRRKLAVLDYGTGVIKADDLSGRPITTYAFTWLLPSRARIKAFKGWLAARAGRLKPFWAPSFRSDFEVVQAIAPTDTGIVVRKTGYAQHVAGADMRRDIEIVTATGAHFYRRITSASEIGADKERLGLDAPLGVTLSPTDVVRVSLLAQARLDQDAIEVLWYTDACAQATIRVLIDVWPT